MKKRHEQLEEENAQLTKWHEDANARLKEAHTNNILSIRARRSSILKEPQKSGEDEGNKGFVFKKPSTVTLAKKSLLSEGEDFDASEACEMIDAYHTENLAMLKEIEVLKQQVGAEKKKNGEMEINCSKLKSELELM